MSIGTRALATLRNSWEKNWPEIHAGLTGGLPRFLVSRRPAPLGSAVPVFCYHVVDPRLFEEDLAFLARNGYTTIDADTLLNHLSGQRPAPTRSVVLTIDDGAFNLFTVAYPRLRKRGLRAVAFIAPGLHNVDRGTASSGSSTDRPCSWAEIRQMHDSGSVDFQSHTLEHRYVPRWPEPIILAGCSPELVQSRRGPPLSIGEDFRRAKEILEGRLGKTVRHLAFTKFNGTPEALEIGRSCGYEAFWWGYLPGHSGNHPGSSPLYVTRLDAIYLRRLPGSGRLSLRTILKQRILEALRKHSGRVR